VGHPASAPAALASIGAKQIHGADPNVGLWQMGKDQDWLTVTHLGGRLFVRTLLPANATRRLVGGPMRPRQIASGPSAGRTYFGGNPQGFEYRLWPAAFLNAPSAAYELGRPIGLGPQFGVGATWGRLDVYPPGETEEIVFLHLLVPADAIAAYPPATSFMATEEMATLDLTLEAQQISTSLSLTGDSRSSVTVRDGSGRAVFERQVTTRIVADADIPRLNMRVP
jgi:hypothetical protein